MSEPAGWSQEPLAARALALSWSNSAWVMAPESSRDFAEAISSAALRLLPLAEATWRM